MHITSLNEHKLKHLKERLRPINGKIVFKEEKESEREFLLLSKEAQDSVKFMMES